MPLLTIDRGALADTVIGNGVKLDNQIQIAHNVALGDNTAIAAGTVIAGSTHIGKNCVIAGACAIAGHLTLVEGVQINGMSKVTGSIHKAGYYSSGTGLDEHQRWRKKLCQVQAIG